MFGDDVVYVLVFEFLEYGLCGRSFGVFSIWVKWGFLSGVFVGVVCIVLILN